METESVASTALTPGSTRDWPRKMYLGIFFVVVWPLFNLVLVSYIFVQYQVFADAPLFAIALRFFFVFVVVFTVVSLLEMKFPLALAAEKFWPQLLAHLGVLVLLFGFSDRAFKPQVLGDVPQIYVVPIVLLFFEVTLYVAVKTFLAQREQHFSTQLTLRQARINLLRSQSNPHFLFNTLNLLASEIGRDPDTAKEIVYDLSDLLRESMRAADLEFIAVREELRLAALYLGLQQKRFPDRMQFDIQVAPECELLQIPALLLQPVVENAVKHVVADSTKETRISIDVQLREQELVLKVLDTGPRVDHGAVQRGGGFRILGETLASHYPGAGRMTFTSSEAGGEVAIRLPQTTGVHLVHA